MAKRFKYRAGFTLIEIMVATVIFVIAVLGTSGFRYHANLGAREADSKLTAAHIALLLCESWRGASDPNEFDAEDALNLEDIFGSEFEAIFAIDGTEHGPYVADEFTLLDYYKIEIDDNDEGDEITYWVTLSWQDVSPGLRALNVVVAWDPRSSSSDYYRNGGGRSFKLTTYVGS